MEALDFILKMSFSGSILFLIICIFKPLTKKIFSDTWHYYMLVTTLLIFILPVGSFVSLPKIVDYKVPTPMESVSKITQNNKMLNIKEDINRETEQDNDELKTIDKNISISGVATISYTTYIKDMIFYIWIIGAIIFLSREVYFYKSFYKKLKNMSTEIETEEDINEILEVCKKRLNINKKVIVRECSRIKSPMLTGIFNPIITIPKIEHNKDKLEMIFSHELIHYKRKDLCVKVIALIVNIINWFNPIAYIIRNSINITCELSLDEQLVKNMDKSKRKYYGEVILELIEYSQKKSLILGTSVCNSRKELETRLKKIIYFKKSKKVIAFISFIATIVFTSTSVFAANNITSTGTSTSNNSILNATIKPDEFAVFVSSDGLYMSKLKEINTTKLDEGTLIKLPVISREGSYVAYTKSDSLYICNIKTGEKEEVSKDIESYNFDSKGDLIYSTKGTGMSMYSINAKKSISIISNEYKYYNINCDSKNKIYANKISEYTEGKSLNSKALGIISYDLDNKSEKLILEGKAGTDKEFKKEDTIAETFESLGTTPTISGISNDDKYLYIWNKPKSGSMSADMTEYTVYDILNNKFIEFNNDNAYALGYKNNISQNPVNSNLVALNSGVYRDMFSNKTLGILNTDNNTFTNLLPENQVSMTPCYSGDGKNILYSGANMLEYKNDDTNLYTTWKNEPHNIYEVNAETQKITQITSGKYFDFMPKYLSNNEILFVREDGDSFSLWKTKDGVETKLAESVNFNSKYTDTWYYGHYKTEKVIDVFIG